MVDGVRYESTRPWPAATVGASLQLIDLAQDNSRPSNWTTNLVERATPGAPNSVAASLPPYDALWLNEVQIANLTGFVDNMTEADPWIELYNSGAAPLNLEGYYLAVDYDTALTLWPFPAGTTLAPGEYRIIRADGQPEQSTGDELHTSFRLDFSGRLALVRGVNGQPQITDYLTWNRLGANVSYGGRPDGQSVFRMVLHQPTPGVTNVEPALRVFINEWMARNSAGIQDPADQARDDWFEIHNAEPFTVDLGGFYFTDNALNPTKYRVPSTGRYRIAPGGFLLAWADEQTNQNSAARADLHVDFKLNGDAGIIGLFAPDGLTQVDFVNYGEQTNDVSQGRYADGAARSSPSPIAPRIRMATR
jgi:hypothetical protein